MHSPTLRAHLASLSLVAAMVPAAEGGVEEREDGASSRYSSFPAGGTWNHGTLQYVYSKYFHNTRKHGSSVINGNGNRVRSANVGGGAWAVATVWKTMAGNTAYWRIY